MFESLSHLALQQYWWIIISFLGSLLVFFMFVQGGQTLIYQIGKTDEKRTLLINSIGRKWELAFTTLVTFGGAFFASFPLFYATSFGGAYWVWMILLFGYIIQAVSYEYRKKPNNFLGQKTYEAFLFINGLIATVLIGIIVGTFYTGSEFFINEYNLSAWQNNARGLEAVLSIQNLSLGLTILFLSRISGALYFINTIEDENILTLAKRQLKYNAIPFLVFFLLFATLLLTKQGFAFDPETKIVAMENFKYLHNFLEMPIILVMFLAGVILVLTGIFVTLFKGSRRGIWHTGTGTILTVFSLFLIAGLNHTAYYPSIYDLQSSLTIENSSSSHYTLTVMGYVSLMIIFVIAYIWYVWKLMNKKTIDEEELNDEVHSY